MAICQPAGALPPRAAFACCTLIVFLVHLKQAGNGLQDKPYPNRPGSALTIVVAVPAVVEEAEEAGMIAR